MKGKHTIGSQVEVLVSKNSSNSCLPPSIMMMPVHFMTITTKSKFNTHSASYFNHFKRDEPSKSTLRI